MDILLEQVVYGSFPFWARGYDVLARSPGCRPDWLAEVLTACRQFGEAPAGSEPAPCLFATRLPSGPWAVVGVEPQGSDDRGRPGALAFHALLILDRDYRKAGSDPFRFAGALGRDWSADSTLDRLIWTVGPPEPLTADPRTSRIVEALRRGRRVVIESAGPVEGLAREVWQALPESRRRRASVATWAFGNDNRFDLIAVPRLASARFDSSYVDGNSVEPVGAPKLSRRPMVVGGVASLLAAGLGWRIAAGRRSGSPVAPEPEAAEVPVDAQERARLIEGLEALADHFEGFEIGRWGDPGELMVRISDRVRYRGALLSSDERAGLALESDLDRDQALGWHRKIQTFAGPGLVASDFNRLSLRGQVAAFARSYGVEPSRRLDAVPPALKVALSRDGPVRPTPLAVRYPALSDYSRFLGRLPRLEK